MHLQMPKVGMAAIDVEFVEKIVTYMEKAASGAKPPQYSVLQVEWHLLQGRMYICTPPCTAVRYTRYTAQLTGAGAHIGTAPCMVHMCRASYLCANVQYRHTNTVYVLYICIYDSEYKP